MPRGKTSLLVAFFVVVDCFFPILSTFSDNIKRATNLCIEVPIALKFLSMSYYT